MRGKLFFQKLIPALKTVGIVTGAITGSAAVIVLLVSLISAQLQRKEEREANKRTAITVDSIYHQVRKIDANQNAFKEDIQDLKKVSRAQTEAINTTQKKILQSA